MDLSIIIPAFNEEESIKVLFEEIQSVLSSKNYIYEIIIIDDGSTDKTWSVIKSLILQNTNIKAVRFKKNVGKSAALDVGFSCAMGLVVITMDADLQDDPSEIPELYDMILHDGYHLVSGWKKRRLDPLSKTIPTKLYNWATRWMSGISLHDFNCGLKAYALDVIKDIRLSGEMHRYIPLLVKNAGYKKIGEKVVNHRKRTYGVTKYGGWNRFSNGLLDLISISFLHKFGKSPMHLFGFLGMFCFFVGFLIASYLTYAKYFLSEYNMTDRPLFYLGMLCMIIGSQLFLSGFLGELIIRNKPIDHTRKINEKLGF
jgi:glycosyltransferase involved in cell wall biosynthesis